MESGRPLLPGGWIRGSFGLMGADSFADKLASIQVLCFAPLIYLTKKVLWQRYSHREAFTHISVARAELARVRLADERQERPV